MTLPTFILPEPQERRDESQVLQVDDTPNNQFIVWDRLLGNWIGTWEADALKSQLMFNFHLGEALHGGIITPDGIPVQLLYNGCTDDYGTHPGMIFEAGIEVGDQEARGAWVNVELEHSYGAWATFIESEDVGVRVGPRQVAPDNTVRAIFGSSTYTDTNINDDQLSAGREDYAALMPAAGLYINGSKGLAVSKRTHRVQKLRFPKKFRSLLLRIETMRGWVGVRRIAERLKPRAFGRGKET